MNRELAFNLFIGFLDFANIRYAILGDTSRYPEEIGSDIDFIIDKNSYLMIEKRIQEFCSQNGFFLVQKIQYEPKATKYVITHASEAGCVYLQLDFCYDYSSSGVDYIEGSELLKNITKSRNGNFNILLPSYSFIYYFIKKVEKGNVSNSQFSFLKSCFGTNTKESISLLKRLFTDASIIKIAEIFTNDDIKFFQQEVKTFQVELLATKGKPLKAIAAELFRKLKRIVQPTGLIIGILGRDGTGKSTLINHLEKEMSLVFPNIQYYHLYPGLLLNNKKKENFSSPHKKAKRSSATSFLKLVVFYLEYTLGFWIKLYPKKVKSTLVIMDRYFVDIYADPDRYRNSNSKYVIWLTHNLLPKPDLWIILDASTEAVFKRKQEVEFAVSEMQRQKYLELGKKLKHAYILDTETDIKNEVLSAVGIINNKLASKFHV